MMIHFQFHFNDRISIAQVKPEPPESQAQAVVHSSAIARVSYFRRWQSGKDVGNYSTSRAVITWHILAQVFPLWLVLQRALRGVRNQCSHICVVQVRWAYAMPILWNCMSVMVINIAIDMRYLLTALFFSNTQSSGVTFYTTIDRGCYFLGSFFAIPR